jgi:hypothetical protein
MMIIATLDEKVVERTDMIYRIQDDKLKAKLMITATQNPRI